MARLSKTAQKALDAVKGKRARIVVDHITRHGSITTDDLKNKYGYDHPPRAIKDVSDQGIPIIKSIVRKGDGKRMAEYRFGDLDAAVPGRGGGRTTFSKSFKNSLVASQGEQCAVCNAGLRARFLQIDHRVPYLVGGDSDAGEGPSSYMLVCASCNRAKSWTCEHCSNGTTRKDREVCLTCYWASPQKYTHIATHEWRRLDITWTDDEVATYDAAQKLFGGADALPPLVKAALRKLVATAVNKRAAPEK